MTELQEGILNGTKSMYEKSGEMIPVNNFRKSDIDTLVNIGKIGIVKSTYVGIDGDFFGLIGEWYPIDIIELTAYRSMRESFGDNDVARSLCKCNKFI